MRAQTYRLFFALHPDASAAGEIEHVVAALKIGGSVHGRWVKAQKHHVTVQFLGTHAGRPGAIIEQARGVAAQIRLAPFEIVLDRVETFGGHRQAPCVLRCAPDSDKYVRTLHSMLGKALAAAGLARLLEGRFTPHVTIAYVNRHLAQPMPVAPVAWQVREFALVESDEARHAVLDRWSLSPPA